MSNKKSKFNPTPASEDETLPVVPSPSSPPQAEPKRYVVVKAEPLPERTRIGPGSKYPFGELDVPHKGENGEQVFDGIEADRQTARSITAAARQYSKTHPGVKFVTRVVSAELVRVVRVA